MEEGLGLGGSSIMEIQSEWYGEDTGEDPSDANDIILRGGGGGVVG